MGFTDKIRRQLRSVIEWPAEDENLLFSQWTDNGDEIKNASKLIIKPGQGCIFVHRGEVKAVHSKEGIYNLKTDNIPFVTTLIKFMQFFESEHKVGIYFFRSAKVLNQKWGTSTPIKYQDPLYQFPVGLKAYGNYSYQLAEPELFFRTILGSQPQITIEEVRSVISTRLLQPISDYLAESSFSYAELDSKQNELSNGIFNDLQPTFSKLGISITDFRIEGMDFDDATQQRINRIADVTASSVAAKQAGVTFQELQQLEALKAAAENEGGAAGAGVGIGAGIGLGQQMATSMTPKMPAAEGSDVMSSMTQLKQLFEAEMITAQEYADKKQELLKKL